MELLNGSLRWQAAALHAITEHCPAELNKHQIDTISQYLDSDDSTFRIDAASNLRKRGTGDDLVLKAILKEENKNVINSMIMSYLIMNGVSENKSIRIADRMSASENKITKKILDDLVKENT